MNSFEKVFHSPDINPIKFHAELARLFFYKLKKEGLLQSYTLEVFICQLKKCSRKSLIEFHNCINDILEISLMSDIEYRIRLLNADLPLFSIFECEEPYRILRSFVYREDFSLNDSLSWFINVWLISENRDEAKGIFCKSEEILIEDNNTDDVFVSEQINKKQKYF